MQVDTRDMLISPYLLLDGIWEAQITALFQKLVKPGMTFVDIGANIGYYSLLAAKLAGHTAKVYAFEPEPLNFELLRKNVIMNWFTEIVRTEKVAVSDRRETAEFYVRENYRGNSSRGAVTEEHLKSLYDSMEKIEVQTTSLDEYFPSPPKIDVLKIDVEGAELDAFKGMRNVLRCNPEIVIICEWSLGQMGTAGRDPKAVLEEFRLHALRPYSVESDYKSMNSEDLLKTEYCNLVLSRAEWSVL
jgi:FkbM family methyltransferase